MDREMKLVRSDTEEILRLIKGDAEKMAAAKQVRNITEKEWPPTNAQLSTPLPNQKAHQTALMHSVDIDEIDDAIDRILKLRLDEDPNSFPSEDMKGEVRKEGSDAFCSGTI